MSPITHFLVGWAVANVGGLDRRERAVVAIAGVIPDLDGLGVIADFLTRSSAHPLNWWGEYHHVLAHNLTFALVVTAAGWVLAKRRWLTAALALASFHLHLLGDLVGARGPEGEQWPILYLMPFTRRVGWIWSGQWALNAWPNFVITGLLLLAAFYLAWRRGFSPLEMVSSVADRAFLSALRKRFPQGETETRPG